MAFRLAADEHLNVLPVTMLLNVEREASGHEKQGKRIQGFQE